MSPSLPNYTIYIIGIRIIIIIIIIGLKECSMALPLCLLLLLLLLCLCVSSRLDMKEGKRNKTNGKETENNN